MLKSFKELAAWQKAYSLCLEVYRITDRFPQREAYGLAAQMRRAAVSIPSNIAEGYRRHSRKEYLQFLTIAYGSTGELQTQLLLSKDLGFVQDGDFESLYGMVEEVAMLLFKLMDSLRIRRQNLNPEP